ncbi:MAG: serine hydrolase domain-containing protein [Vicinamibacterales bacterium]
MKRTLSLLAALLVLFVAVPSTQTPSLDAVLAQLETQLAADFATDGVGGASIGVIVGPKLVWTKHYGFADMEAKRVPTNETAYRIGSITKQFTALALLRQVEAGTMTLSDPLEKHVPELKALRNRKDGWPAPTLLQAATMMSGIAREPGPECKDHSVGPLAVWQQKVLGCLPLTSYAHEPGSRYLYSNIGYATLGIAIERAGKKSFTDQVIEGIAVPLAMTRTAWEASPMIRKDLAHGYTRRDGKADRTRPDRELDGRGYRVPNGNLFSTVDDLARFVMWELGALTAPVIVRDTQTFNYARTYSANGTMSSGYGLGFMVSRRGDLVALGHGGSTAGFRASALFNPRTSTGVVVLRNAEGGSFDAGPVALRILEKVASTQGPVQTR